MPKTFVNDYERFTGGIADDARNPGPNQLGNIEHFILEDKKLIPHRSTEAVETKASDITKFVFAPNNTDYSLYGFGLDSSTARVYEIDDADVTAASPSWSAGIGAAGTGAPDRLVFSHFKNYIYYWEAGARLARFGPLSGARGIATYQTISYTDVAETVHHPADDTLYLFSDNKVHTQTDNATAFTEGVQTIPDNMKIVSCTSFGNYLAIGAAPLQQGAGFESVVFMWNRDSSSTLFSHKYSIGFGDLKVLANVGGQLVAVVDEFTTSTFGNFRGAAVVYRLEGNEFVEKHRLDQTTIGQAFYTDSGLVRPSNKVETGTAVYWAMKLVRGNDTITGIWKYNNKNALSVEFIEEDDDGNGINGFYRLGNYWWVAHSADGSVNRTDDQANFTFTSKADTPVIGDGYKTRVLKGVSVRTEPLPTSGQIVVKYRKDSESSFTSLKTFTTDNDIRHEVPPSPDMPNFKEVQIRIESTGGAVITGIRVVTEELTDSSSH